MAPSRAEAEVTPGCRLPSHMERVQGKSRIPKKEGGQRLELTHFDGSNTNRRRPTRKAFLQRTLWHRPWTLQLRRQKSEPPCPPPTSRKYASWSPHRDRPFISLRTRQDLNARLHELLRRAAAGQDRVRDLCAMLRFEEKKPRRRTRRRVDELENRRSMPGEPETAT